MKNQTKQSNTELINCPRCPRWFASKNALSMHIGRVHTGSIVPGKRRRPISREERIINRREYSRRWRQARGITPNPKMWRKENDKRGGRRIKTRRHRFTPIVFPDPTKQTQPEQTQSTLNYCPTCGEHLSQWKKE